MASGVSKDIQPHMYATSYSFNLQITKSDTRPHIKWAVSLVIVDGQFNLPLWFVQTYMG